MNATVSFHKEWEDKPTLSRDKEKRQMDQRSKQKPQKDLVDYYKNFRFCSEMESHYVTERNQ